MIGNPLLKLFPLSGYTQVVYTVKKGLLFIKVTFLQKQRLHNYNLSWFAMLVILSYILKVAKK